jgi:hypothetical protein
MLNRRTAVFGLMFLISGFLAGAALPRSAPYPVLLTSAIVAGLLVGFVGMVAFMIRTRVGSMEFDPEAKVLTLRVASAEQRFALNDDVEFGEFGVPEGVPYATGCHLLFLRQGGQSASLWYMNAGPGDIERWRTLPAAQVGRSSLRVSPDAGRTLHLFLRGDA